MAGKVEAAADLIKGMVSRADSWENILTGLGMASRDKREAATIKKPKANTNQQRFENLFASSDVAARYATLPAREMTREWIELTVDSEAETDSDEAADIPKLMLGRMEELKIAATFFEAITWARVHGGSGIFMGIDDGLEPHQPLNEAGIIKFDFLSVFDRWELHIHSKYMDPKNPKFGKPEFYSLQGSKSGGAQNSEITPLIHETRMLIFDGVMTTSYRRKENAGWGDSIYIKTEDVIRDFEQSYAGVAAHLQDWGQFVYKLQGLATMLKQDDDKLVLKRLRMLDMSRSMIRAIALDADRESAERVSTPAAGIDGLLDRMGQRLGQALEVPLTLLLSMSPAGLNATGESDIRLFYDQIKAKQKLELKDPIERIIKLLFLSSDGPTNGVEPESWTMDFVALWQMTEKEKAEVRKLQSETDGNYIGDGVLDPEEVANSRFSSGGMAMSTTLDLEERAEKKKEAESFAETLRSMPMGAMGQPPEPGKEEEEPGEPDDIEES